MNIRFYNDNGKWYADLPKWIDEGNDKEELQMVDGADTWLDILSECGSEITLKISLYSFHAFDGKLLYVGDVNKEIGTYLVYPDDHYLWLCRVAVWLFKEYPQVIYYKIIDKNESTSK